MKRIETKQDMILKWLTSGNPSEKLSPDLQKQFDRINYADNLVCNFMSIEPDVDRPSSFSFSEIANMISKKFGVSIATAYRDINDAQYIFKSTRPLSKDYIRGILFEIGMNSLYRLYKKMHDDDVLKGIEKIGKILGLHLNESNIPDWKSIQPHQYFMLVQINKNDFYKIDLSIAEQMEESEAIKILQSIQDVDIDFEDVK